MKEMAAHGCCIVNLLRLLGDSLSLQSNAHLGGTGRVGCVSGGGVHTAHGAIGNMAA